MDLRIERVSEANESLLLRYCAEHGAEHDASFLPGRDFALSPDHPAYLLLKDRTAVGAVILMRSSRYLSTRRGRFSILHSTLDTHDAYSMLLGAIRRHFHDLRTVYMFIPEDNQNTATILSKLGFHIERFSFVLRTSGPMPAEVEFPDGYMVHHLGPSDSVGISQFAQCLNQAFSELAGHTDSSANDIRAWFDHQDYIEGGICLLRRNGEPAGTVCVMRDAENRQAGELTALGILGQHRRMGLGRRLLRYATSFALRTGLNPVILSVNAENAAALRLYNSEGYVLTETVVCYALDCA